MSSGGGGKKNGGSFEATDYRLGIHYAVCAGPVDEIQDITVSDKSLGFAPVSENSSLAVDDMELFGGPKKGGGLKGIVHFLLGAATQVLPETLAAKLDRTSSTVTGYRNICSVWFAGDETEGFTWSTNVPAVPPPKIKVRRAPVGLSGEAMIGSEANPAHIVYECLVNADWGAGYPMEVVNTESFLSAAQTLRDENFGLSLIWRGQTTIEAFVNEILQHISANLIFDLATSKWSLNLLRNDYDTAGILEINPRNAELKSFQRRSWGETINEVIVTWVNPDNEEEETVTQQDASGFAVQKTAVSDGSKNYPGIRSQDLAWKVAERDLRQAGTPLAAVEVDVNLSMRGLKPGDVLWFNWDEEDEDGDVFLEPIVVRVLKVKEPKRGAAGFEVSLIEDVFSYGLARTTAQDSAFYSPDQDPVDVPHVDFVDSPYFAVAQQFGDSGAQALEYPQGHVSVFSNTGLVDLRETELFSERPVPEQNPAYVSVATLDDVGRFTLAGSLAREAESSLPLPTGYVPTSLVVGGFLVLGEGSDQEMCVVTAFSSGVVTLRRGCLDTVPRNWGVGTPVWEVRRSSLVVDGTEVLAGEVLKYKLLPVTSVRRLPLSDATEHTMAVGERMHLPSRPANVSVDGISGFAFTLNATAASAVVTWANRNRLTETSQVLAWSDTGVPPETNQVTNVQFYRTRKNLADRGADPSTMNPAGPSTSVTAAGSSNYLGFGTPAIVSGDVTYDQATVHSGEIDCTSSKRVLISVFCREGTSGLVRLFIYHTVGVLSFHATFSSLATVLDATGYTVHSSQFSDLGSGNFELKLDVTIPGGDSTTYVAVGPRAASSGENVEVTGVSVMFDEAGQGVPVANLTGVTGETAVLDLSSENLVYRDEYKLQVGSTRDSFDSWQVGDFLVTVT